MGVRMTLTSEAFPPSRHFIGFLEQWATGQAFDGTSWARHGSERVENLGRQYAAEDVLERLETLNRHDKGRQGISRAYQLFMALLEGDSEALRPLHDKFRFILVVGAPRSGGKYITKQLFHATGYDPETVPEVLGHDGFPDAGPWRFGNAGNGWIASLQTMAEYLTMVELFFGDRPHHGAQIVVPKKATKAVYAAGLFETALGPLTEAVITLRHPVPSCISTYETGGGLPAGGTFSARSNIEKFCARDLVSLGHTREEVGRMDYFGAYLRYWEAYNERLAIHCAGMARRGRVLAFAPDCYAEAVSQFKKRFGGGQGASEPLQVRDRRASHPDWTERAEPSLRRVQERWERAGLDFPASALEAAW